MSNTNNSNRLVVPGAREAMDKFKMEAANEVGVNLKQGYNGDLTSRQAGSVGGQMVKKMIEAYENGLKLETQHSPFRGKQAAEPIEGSAAFRCIVSAGLTEKREHDTMTPL